MLPFQNPVFEPLRHLIPAPDDQPDLNIGQKISDLVIDKKNYRRSKAFAQA